jgi:MinD-like ATPase involved in chromosome partitioning or flagellar assembly
LGHTIAVIFTPAPELAYQASAHNLPIVLQQPDSLTSQQFSKLAERITQRSRQ